MTTITEARSILRALSARAMRVRGVLETLATKRIFLSREKTVDAVANAMWLANSSGDEDSSPAFYEDEAIEVLDQEFASTEIAGLSCFIVKPFSAGPYSRFSQELNLSYLETLKSKCSVAFLLAAESVELGSTDPVGLSTVESEWLGALITAKSLKWVNAFRDCETALHYIFTARSGRISSCGPLHMLGEDEGIDELLASLREALAIPSLTPVATHYGTEASRINTLTDLPSTLTAELLG